MREKIGQFSANRKQKMSKGLWNGEQSTENDVQLHVSLHTRVKPVIPPFMTHKYKILHSHQRYWEHYITTYQASCYCRNTHKKIIDFFCNADLSPSQHELLFTDRHRLSPLSDAEGGDGKECPQRA